ncbi:magnesium/cobalt transporter CorA [Cetobacterium sp. 2A]|uniref:magnesium/cobalt transporter CorA n=1 Tax=Cetobacterium sp. 2A TaxID=2754723 RepID=UPI00163C0B1E|nr:magnesium/cobalt transporter CorA [Cetobacterium sp. 2A]MBC2855700.1 magnesium/cobalt transporter CorA [Cetobacterium sp. 2A]
MAKKQDHRKKSKKIGLAPGTLVYTGLREKEEIGIICYSYNVEEVEVNIYKQDVDIELLKPKKDITWIDVDGIHNVDLIENIGKLYNIDYLILEDLLNNGQRPKLDEREDFIFIVLKMITLKENTDEIEYEQVSFILGSNFLITFQEKPKDIFKLIRNRIDHGLGKTRKRGASYLTYGLLDTIVDHYFLILEKFELQIEELEDKVLNQPTKEDMGRIMDLKQNVANFKKSISPIREIAIKLENSEFFEDNVKIYLKDLYDHSIVISENTEALHTRVSELIQLYHSSIGNTMNETMKVLTIISTIFMPLSFLAGLYGMNFEYMPELKMKYGYYGLIIIMIFVMTSMIVYFRKKKWW